MNHETFRQAISGIFASHGKAAPTGNVLNAIWERVNELPDQFMGWARGEMCDMEKLPGNIGYHVASVLWPLWRRNNPALRAREGLSCSECGGKHDLSGSGFYCFKQDDEGWQMYFSPCRCMSMPTGYRLNPKTKAQAVASGYKLVPDGWAGTVADYEAFLRFGELRVENRRVGRYGAALNKVGKIDPFGKEERRFRHVDETEWAAPF